MNDLHEKKSEGNLKNSERLLSGVSGLALALYGLRSRSLPGFALALLGGALVKRGVSGYCPLYKKLNIKSGRSAAARRVVRRSIHLFAPPAEVYRFWRNPENLLQLSDKLVEVRAINGTRSFWKTQGPGGTSFEWHSEIIEDHPNEIIAWQSISGTSLENAGSVRFKSAGRGTELHIQFAYRFHPTGIQPVLGAVSEKIVEQEIESALSRLQHILDKPSGEFA